MVRWQTPEEVSELIQIPVATLARWRYMRTGPPSVRIGKHVRYDPDDVERWLDERRAADEWGRAVPDGD